MAGKKVPYLVKEVSASSISVIKRLVAQGWEPVGEAGGALGSMRKIVLRRPNPKYEL